MASKAVQEARARLAAVDAEIKAFDEQFAQRDTLIANAQAKVRRATAKYAKRPVIKAQPQNEYEVRRDGLAAFHLGWSGSEALKGAKRAFSLAKALIEGNEKVSFGNSGMPGTFKGVAAKTKYVTPATVKELDRLDRLALAAEKRGREARARWKDAKKAAYEAASQRPSVEDIALAVAEQALINREAVRSNSFDSYRRERLEQHDRVDAVKHLDAAVAKVTPCPCNRCQQVIRQAAWDAESKARAADKAAKAKAHEKAVAKAPKVSFICPACSEESVSSVIDGDVTCGYTDDCRWSGAAIALRTKRVPKSSPVGPLASFDDVETDEDEDEDAA